LRIATKEVAHLSLKNTAWTVFRQIVKTFVNSPTSAWMPLVHRRSSGTTSKVMFNFIYTIWFVINGILLSKASLLAYKSFISFQSHQA